jgi:hypothetical protein
MKQGEGARLQFIVPSGTSSASSFFPGAEAPGYSQTPLRGLAGAPLVVDYLQLMSGGGKCFENRTGDVSSISRGLKAIAVVLSSD